MEAPITVCKLESRRERELRQGLWTNLGGGMGPETGGGFKREGTCVDLRLIHAEV